MFFVFCVFSSPFRPPDSGENPNITFPMPEKTNEVPVVYADITYEEIIEAWRI